MTSDFGRNYKCVDKYRGSYRMEDWLHFVCVFSPYIFQKGTLPPLLEEMWGELQTVILHYFGRSEWTADNSRKASDALLRYAVLMEENNFPNNMFTFNLHICVCQLARQEAARGATSNDIELVVERGCGEFKTVTGRSPCKDPEKVYANSYLLDRALLQVADQNPGLRSYEELTSGLPAGSFSTKKVGPLWDLGEGPVAFRGLGRLLPNPERAKCLEASLKYLEVTHTHTNMSYQYILLVHTHIQKFPPTPTLLPRSRSPRERIGRPLICTTCSAVAKERRRGTLASLCSTRQ